MEKITVVLPCYNEARRLPPTLGEIEDFMRTNSHVIEEIIVVDDGSKDATVERAMYWSDKLPLRVERFMENQGKWAAIRRGIEMSITDAILLLDADGSAPITVLRDIPVKQIVEEKGAVFGSRFCEGATCEGKTGIRLVVSQVYRMYARALYTYATGRKDVDDMQAPWKLFHKSTLQFPLTVDRFAGDIELAAAISVPIRTQPLDFLHKRGSKVGVSSVVQMAAETARVAQHVRSNR